MDKTTDALRKWAGNAWRNDFISDCALNDLRDIADRIDAAHDDALAKATDGMVRLPRDADGEVIEPGDIVYFVQDTSFHKRGECGKVMVTKRYRSYDMIAVMTDGEVTVGEYSPCKLTHKRPYRTVTEIADEMEQTSDFLKAHDADDGDHYTKVDPDWLAQLANELREAADE